MSETSTPPNDGIRLQKWCSQLGLASRRESEQWIAAGRLFVNGKKASLGTKIIPDVDTVLLDGRPLSSKNRAPFVYWMLNKPKGFLCSTKSEGEMQTIYDLPALKNIPFKVDPVGRLDFLSEGLLLLTNDGELLHRLCHPSFKIERHYQVLSDRKLDLAQIEKIKKGIELEDGKSKADISLANSVNLGKSKGYWYFVTLTQGKKRIIRRIFAAFECKVLRLRRYGIGELRLGKMREGEIYQLNAEEIRYLKDSVRQKIEAN